MDNLSAVDTSPQEAMNPEHLALDLWAMAARSGLRPLKIGMHTVLPIVQGGMGVGVSAGGLAGTVAGMGGVGTVSSVDLRRHHRISPTLHRLYDQAFVLAQRFHDVHSHHAAALGDCARAHLKNEMETLGGLLAKAGVKAN